MLCEIFGLYLASQRPLIKSAKKMFQKDDVSCSFKLHARSNENRLRMDRIFSVGNVTGIFGLVWKVE